jgi:hypothetical protein
MSSWHFVDDQADVILPTEKAYVLDWAILVFKVERSIVLKGC